MRKSCSNRFAQPISIYSTLHISQPLVIKIHPIHQILFIRSFRIISGQPLEFQFFSGIHHIIITEVRHLNREISIIRQTQCPRSGTLCFNNHYTISSARTVDCRGCRIFQNGYRSDPFHIQIDNRLQVDLKTIQYKQRLIRINCIIFLQINNTRFTTNINIG